MDPRKHNIRNLHPRKSYTNRWNLTSAICLKFLQRCENMHIKVWNMVRYTYSIVVYLRFILSVHIYHCILFVLNTFSLEYHLNVQSVNIYISLVIFNDNILIPFRECVKFFLNHSNSFIDISFDTSMAPCQFSSF